MLFSIHQSGAFGTLHREQEFGWASPPRWAVLEGTHGRGRIGRGALAGPRSQGGAGRCRVVSRTQHLSIKF